MFQMFQKQSPIQPSSDQDVYALLATPLTLAELADRSGKSYRQLRPILSRWINQQIIFYEFRCVGEVPVIHYVRRS